MNTILTAIFSGFNPASGIICDAAPPLQFLAIGAAAVIIIGVIIVLVIVFGIRLLTRMKNKKTQTPK